MKSQKTVVIEHLFFKNWDPEKRRLRKSMMSFSDVQDAIRYCNREFGTELSDRNPANFMKDIVRGQAASSVWPEALKELGYTAIQRPGEGNVFEFVPFPPGQKEPFPDVYKPSADTPSFPIQSISMPLAAKDLGRADEPWLIQTAVNLRVIETHFSVVSDIPVVELTHLQMSVKLRKTEIDAIFLARCREGNDETDIIVTCEAKQWRERILEAQIVNQVQAAFSESAIEAVVPLGLRAIKNRGFYVAEFEKVTRKESAALETLTLAKEAIYELVPPVRGI